MRMSAWALAVLLGAIASWAAYASGTAGAQGRAPEGQWKRGLPTAPEYFPIGVWLQDPANARAYKAAGLNLYIGLWQGPTDEQLARLASAGMPVICDQNETGLKHIANPIIVGWMHGDEPDNAQPVTGADGRQGWGSCVPPQRIVDDYARLRAKDPSRPVLLNLGQGVANDEWVGRGAGAKLSDYETYVQGADIVSFDVYPVAGIGRPDGENHLWLVAKGVERLVRWTGGRKRIWSVIEVSRIDSDRKVTPAQLRAEVWMALVHGSTGLIYFTHQWKPSFSDRAVLDDTELLPAFTALNAQIKKLAPVLNSPTVAGAVGASSSSDAVPIAVMAKRHGGALYAFAVGMRNAPARGTMTCLGVPDGTSVDVIDEGRTLRVQGGAFTDEFAPYGVHLYRIGARKS